MTTAAAAAEYRSNVGHDFTLADAYDAEYLDDELADERDRERKPRGRRASSDDDMPLAGVRRPQGERVGAFLI